MSIGRVINKAPKPKTRVLLKYSIYKLLEHTAYICPNKEALN
jgi:hypothetical protein